MSNPVARRASRLPILATINGALAGGINGFAAGYFDPAAIFWQVAALFGAFIGASAGLFIGYLISLLGLRLKTNAALFFVAFMGFEVPQVVWGYIITEALDRKMVAVFLAVTTIVAISMATILFWLKPPSPNTGQIKAGDLI